MSVDVKQIEKRIASLIEEKLSIHLNAQRLLGLGLYKQVIDQVNEILTLENSIKFLQDCIQLQDNQMPLFDEEKKH